MYYSIYENTEDNKARFALGKPGTKPLFVFGVNPSTACDTKPDKTMRMVEGFASRHGFNGFLMLNLYPLRSTYIKDLPSTPDKELCRRNIATIHRHFQAVKSPSVWAAWGNPIATRSYLADCLAEICEEIKIYSASWQHCGSVTKPGNPRHPSRLAHATTFRSFDLQRYLGEKCKLAEAVTGAA